ncbi:hypothetical protein FSP39_019745 [Pinctada imbricata]|uniref:Uncharacterized protein n=1 Tax=Pinctada imbricata TaxID=66713 RepID=A0AA88XIB5_PINIB|nr:hypothetical protein FSP39_019745 [Pinctada imbricata]
MKELAICLVLTVILAGVNGQECTSAKLDECNVIYQKFVTAGVSDMAETCRIVTEFDVCIEPCKTLDANDPLYERTYEGVKKCLEPLMEKCKNEASYTSIQENLQNYEAQCASGN